MGCQPLKSLVGKFAIVPVLAGTWILFMSFAQLRFLGLLIASRSSAFRNWRYLILNCQVPSNFPWKRLAFLLLFLDPLVSEGLLLSGELDVAELAFLWIMGERTEPKTRGKALVLRVVPASPRRSRHRLGRRGRLTLVVLLRILALIAVLRGWG